MAYNVITDQSDSHKEIVFSENDIGYPTRIVLDKDSGDPVILLEDEHGDRFMLVNNSIDLNYLIKALDKAQEWGWLDDQL